MYASGESSHVPCDSFLYSHKAAASPLLGVLGAIQAIFQVAEPTVKAAGLWAPGSPGTGKTLAELSRATHAWAPASCAAEQRWCLGPFLLKYGPRALAVSSCSPTRIGGARFAVMALNEVSHKL